MPLLLEERPLDHDAPAHFSQVLRDAPDAAEALRMAQPEGHRLVAGIFNARPVAMLLLREDSDTLVVEQLVVHPATRNRGVATELLRLAGQRWSLRWPTELAPLAARAGLA